MAQLLYQAIMGVPGLTGTWQQRNAQLYKALGSPMGAYKGNLQQNLYLLDQIKNKNYGSLTPAPQPAATAPTPAQPAVPLSRQYTDPLTGQLKTAGEIPQFQEVLPYMETWKERLEPGAMKTGEQLLRPEVMRDYNAANYNYRMGMTGSGGERFGRALGGLGDLKAQSGRQYNALLNDWTAQQKQGWTDLWYNKQNDMWNKGITQVKPGGVYKDVPEIPTWDSYYDKYGPAYGAGTSSNLFG